MDKLRVKKKIYTNKIFTFLFFFAVFADVELLYKKERF